MARHKNVDWSLPDGVAQPSGANTHSWESIHTAILMDLRDELRRMRNSIDTVRHFFHTIGSERARVLVREAHFEAVKKRSRRLRRQRAQGGKP